MAGIRLDDTITAISTPIGEAGIGIVRLSGKDSLKIADKIFVSKDGKKPSRFKTYTVHYGHIIDDGRQTSPRLRPGQADGRRHFIDEVILTVMRAPKSYTREDIIEINCHSGIVPLKKILDLVLVNGARIAEPGEFTKRAFLNGRIDILQAESVLDIIKAKTDLSLRAAVSNLEGLFSKRINELRDELVAILAHIEASIDFSEENDVSKIKKKDIFGNLKKVKKDIERLISTASKGKILRQGAKTVICGSPNVGKSSLMNALLRESRAIVTALPGTTRDTIEEIVNIKGIPVILVDTAGITGSTHPIAKEGIKRSRFSIQNADLVLFVLDYGRRLNGRDLDIMHTIRGRESIITINKVDLKKHIDIKLVRKLLPKEPIVYVSSVTLTGIHKLEQVIKNMIFKGKVPTPDFVTVSNNRQLEILRRAFEDIKKAMSSFKDRVPMDCIAVYVRSAIESLGEIAGHTITEDALDRIFSGFCIGK